MGQDSSIQWTDHTFNGWIGCEKVSAGCKNCYAEVETPVRVHRGRGLELWGKGAARHVTAEDTWKKPRKWNREAEKAGERRRVFAQSLSDTFEDRRDLDAPRARLFALIEETPWLDWLLLTKRPEHMVRLAPASWASRWPANVWAGCTVEDQERAEERIPHLLRVPAVVRFLSLEPLLGAVELDLGRCDTHGRDHVQMSEAGEHCSECAADGWSGELSFGHWLDACADAEQPGINWLIIGGESGTRARPFDLLWLRHLLAQAESAGVAAFVKQFGSHVIDAGPAECWPDGTRFVERLDEVGARIIQQGWRYSLRDGHGGDMAEWPEDLRVREFPSVR